MDCSSSCYRRTCERTYAVSRYLSSRLLCYDSGMRLKSPKERLRQRMLASAKVYLMPIEVLRYAEEGPKPRSLLCFRIIEFVNVNSKLLFWTNLRIYIG